MSSVVDLFFRGGIFMWPLLALSIATVAFSLYKTIDFLFFRAKIISTIKFLRSGGKEGSVFSARLSDLFKKHPAEAHALLEKHTQIVFDRQTRVLELIAAIGNLAPLIGFLGTVSGMINAFQAIANAEKVSVKLVASGISEALITTGYGLIIASICAIAEGLFRYYIVYYAHTIEDEAEQAIVLSDEKQV